MAILADSNSRILVCGIDDPLARFQCDEMYRHGTQVVAIVGASAEAAGWVPASGLRFQASVAAATKSTRIDLAMVFSPPLRCKAVIADLVAAGIPVVICLTEHVPVHDAIVLRHMAKRAGVTLIGPNSSGLLSPGRVKAGFFVEDICLPGDVGVIAKSGSLAYAVLSEMKSAGIGISTVVGIGGDAAKGVDFRECLALFAADDATRAIVMLGEIGGSDEENAAASLRDNPIPKPIVAFISGRSIPPGQSMGHAGAIARRGRGDYASKCGALAAAGVTIADTVAAIVQAVTRR